MDTADTTSAHYDFYDYSTFWLGRQYEHLADTAAVGELLNKIQSKHAIIDVGGGLGRLIPCYIDKYDRASLIDPSSVQLKKTEEYLEGKYHNLSFVQGTAEYLPLASGTVDTIICVRVSHHIPDMAPVFDEYSRVLVPGGYVILEVANKLHIKSQIKAFFSGNMKKLHSTDPVSVRTATILGPAIPFVNHNPKAIENLLKEKGFDIVFRKSVSNFRSTWVKKILPAPVLLSIEYMLQVPLVKIWFGPSIYFLARKQS